MPAKTIAAAQRDRATFRYFRKRLALRLIAAVILCTLGAGVGAFFIETERLDETLVDQAAQEAQLFRSSLVADHGEQDDALAAFLKRRDGKETNHYVLAELYGPDHQPMGEAVLPDGEWVESHLNRSAHQFPAPGDYWYRKVLVEDQAFLQVVVPITGPDQSIEGWYEGVYRLSADTVAAVTADVARITGLAMAAVVVTALILYPIMAHQQRLVVAKAQESVRANMETLKVLGSAIAKRDSDTHNHNFRVTVYAVRTAEAMGLPAATVRSLAKGAFLHDIGKIAIPDQILLKPGRLTEGEFTVMRQHVEHGLDIIRSSSWLADGDAVVAAHHEKVDGSGYPRAMKGAAIPIIARIFAVADVFDALTSARPYKDPMPLDQAIEILRKGAGYHFDGAVLDAFLTVLPDLYPLIGGREDGTPERELDSLMERYFGLAAAAP